MGKGGGGNTTQSTGTTYNTNIPEYARPYVETMLGATQQQLFTGPDGKPLEKNAEGYYDIGGFKPYQAYSKNAADYVAPFSPLQQQAQQTVAGMQVPGSYGTAMDITGQGIMGAAGTVGQAQGLNRMGMQAAQAGNQYARQATNPYATAAYMSPYMQNVVDTQQQEAIRQSNIQKTADYGAATKAGAFGGSRQGLIEAERQRNLGTQLGQIQAQGLQSAFDKAQASQQFAANLGLQGQQAGAGMIGQGIGAQQAAYNQAMQGANQYANLGQQAQTAQTNIANLQNQYGAQQQAAEQQKINQSIQDWANAQQYPLMQLGVMSNMLRGLPMQASTTNQYVAAPNPITQGIGAAGAAASLYNATKGASGGLPNEFKYASGGITSVPGYSVGGEIKSQLESMPVEELQKQASSSSSPTVRAMAKEILAEKQMARAEAAKGVAPTGPMGVQYEAPPVQAAAQGGILAFTAGGTKGEEQSLDGIQLAAVTPEEVKREVYTDADKAKIRNDLQAITDRQAAEAKAKEAAATPTAQTTTTAAPAPTVPELSAQETLDRVAKEQKAAGATPITGGPAPAPRPAPQAGGIMQAAAKTPAAPAGPATPAAGPDWLDPATRALYGKAAEDMKKSTADWARERREGLIAAGVDPDNTAAQQQRAQLMAERVNSKDEAQRQRYMRLAEFFAGWGSTPGPTLAAGLSNLQKMVPNLISDEKELKKANRELDKMMYDIDQAIRLEKKGDWDASEKRKEKAAEIGMKMADTMVAGAASIKGHQISAAGQVAAAEKHAAGQVRAQEIAERRVAETERKNASVEYLNAVKAQDAVDKAIKTEMKNDTLYTRNKAIVANAGVNPSPRQAELIRDAQKYVEQVEKDWELRRERAKQTVDLYKDQMKKPAKEDNSGADGAGGGKQTKPIGSYDKP